MAGEGFDRLALTSRNRFVGGSGQARVITEAGGVLVPPHPTTRIHHRAARVGAHPAGPGLMLAGAGR